MGIEMKTEIISHTTQRPKDEVCDFCKTKDYGFQHILEDGYFDVYICIRCGYRNI
jgi:hypothetical protein